MGCITGLALKNLLLIHIFIQQLAIKYRSYWIIIRRIFLWSLHVNSTVAIMWPQWLGYIAVICLGIPRCMTKSWKRKENNKAVGISYKGKHRYFKYILIIWFCYDPSGHRVCYIVTLFLTWTSSLHRSLPFSLEEGHDGDRVWGRMQRCMLENEMLSRGISSVSTTYLRLSPLFCIESSLRWTKVVVFQIWSPLEAKHFPNWASV